MAAATKYNLSKFISIVYDSANDDIAGDLTEAVSVGARYFYSVEDTGGSWYAILASQYPITPEQVQDVWNQIREEWD